VSSNKKNKELNALISMIDEPSNSIFNQIRDKILIHGIEAIPFLEDAWDNSFNNLLQERIEEIIHNIHLNNLLADLKTWKNKYPYDLLRGFCLATKYHYPDLDIDKIRENVEEIRRDIWLELNNNLTALEKIKVINHILFDIHGISGNKTNIDAPQNLFINNLLESKKGNHVSIGILYIILSQQLNIPVFGVDLPQHFILAYTDEVYEGKHVEVKENEVIFYINPFNKGAVFTKREIEVFVKHLKIDSKPEFFNPCDNTTIIKRLFADMIRSYKKLGYLEKVEELIVLAEVL